MLETRMAPASAALKPYVWAYGITRGRVEAAPLVIPLPARPKQLLTFFFADRYRALGPGSAAGNQAPRVTVVGPQSCARAGLSVSGRIETFTVHFQPSGFYRLFGIPMPQLTDAAYDARAVIGPAADALESELGDAPDFVARIAIVERHFRQRLQNHTGPDPIAMASSGLFASHGVQRVSSMADIAGLSPRQFERRFLEQVGLPPKLYARIIRFNAALDHKLRYRSRSWGRIAADHDYYDQTHFLRDCRAFTGDVPSRFLSRLEEAPAFHTFFASADAVRRDD